MITNNREEITRLLDYDEKIYDITTYRKRIIKNNNRQVTYFVPKIEYILDDLAEIPVEYKDYGKSELDKNDIVYHFYRRYLERPNIYIDICFTNLQESVLKIFLGIIRSADKYIQDAENLFYLIPLFSYSKNLVCRAYYLNQQQKNETERVFITIIMDNLVSERDIPIYFDIFYKSILKNNFSNNVYTSIDNCVSDFTNFSNTWRLVEEYIDTL